MIIGPIAAVAFSYEKITGEVIGMPQIPILGRVLIGVSTFIVALTLAYRSLWLKARIEAQNNWITKYQWEHHGKLPELPHVLSSFVANYTSGPISKEIVILDPNIQNLQGLAPRYRKMWEDLVKWKGEDPQDYINHVHMMAPKTPPGAGREKWKPFKQH